MMSDSVHRFGMAWSWRTMALVLPLSVVVPLALWVHMTPNEARAESNPVSQKANSKESSPKSRPTSVSSAKTRPTVANQPRTNQRPPKSMSKTIAGRANSAGNPSAGVVTSGTFTRSYPTDRFPVQTEVMRYAPRAIHTPVVMPDVAHSQEVTQAVHRLRSPELEETERENLVAELRAALDREFESRHRQQQEALQKTRARLDNLQKTLDTRADNQDKIVLRRMNELMGEPDELRWNLEPSPGFGPSLPQPAWGSPSGTGWTQSYVPIPTTVPPNRYSPPPSTASSTQRQTTPKQPAGIPSNPLNPSIQSPPKPFAPSRIGRPNSSTKATGRYEDYPNTRNNSGTSDPRAVRGAQPPAGPSLPKPAPTAPAVSIAAPVPAQRPTEPPRERSDPFTIVRRALSSAVDLRSKTNEVDRLQQLSKKGAVQVNELRKAELELQKLQLLLEVDQKHLQSLEKQAQASSASNLDAIKQAVQELNESSSAVRANALRSALANAQTQYELAKSQLENIRDAMKLLDDYEQKEPKADPARESSTKDRRPNSGNQADEVETKLNQDASASNNQDGVLPVVSVAPKSTTPAAPEGVDKSLLSGEASF